MSGWLNQWYGYGGIKLLYTYVNTTGGAQYYSHIISPRGTRYLLIQMWGGGGVGGPGDTVYPSTGGGGGGGGGYTSCVIEYIPNIFVEFSVGCGGPPDGGGSGTGTSIILSPVGSGLTYPAIYVDGGVGGESPAVGANGGAGGTVYNPIPSVGTFKGTPNVTINTPGGAGQGGQSLAGGYGGASATALSTPYPPMPTTALGFGSPGGYPGLSPYGSGYGAIMLCFYGLGD